MAYTDIDKPTDYFNTKLYTGNATTPTNITGVGFQPDLVWIKNRDNAEMHILADAVRGANKLLESNTSDAELSDTNYIKAFQSDGFQIGSEGAVNGNTQGHVAWNWLASNTTASNTDGSITSTVSANTTAGFSIGTFTKSGDTTVGHGLNSTPSLIITRHRNQASDWRVWHSSFGANEYINLNSTSAKATSTTIWQNTLPTSYVFSMGSLFDNVASIFYAFAEKKGFSKFGSYSGNSSTDGTFVYLGFKPAFVIIKNASDGNNWVLLDNKRNTFNVQNTALSPNTSGADDTNTSNYGTDFLSNGMKMRTSGGYTSNSNNATGDTYIYMAFAENPFVTSTGIPTTAR
jgi:hypothetical protein